MARRFSGIFPKGRCVGVYALCALFIWFFNVTNYSLIFLKPSYLLRFCYGCKSVFLCSVQKKINWANKEAIIVIADEQERNVHQFSLQRKTTKTMVRKRKEKATRRPSLCQKDLKKAETNPVI